MSARCSLVVNGKSVRIAPGDTPVEAAVADGVIAPMAGLHGTGLLGQAAGPLRRRAEIRAHRAEPVSLAALDGSPIDSDVETAPALPGAKRAGTITEISYLGARRMEVVTTLTKPMDLEPGHLVSLAVDGFAPVVLAPTLRLDGATELNELVFHVRRDGASDPDGLARALEDTVTLGHFVKVKGPEGRGHYRRGGGRLVLVAGETGFAAIWSIARAARYVEPAREIAMVVGASDPLDLYARPALEWLRATGVARIVLAADRNRQRPPDVRPGPLTAHVPPLRATDAVYVSGCPSTVGAVEVLAASVGARCYPIPLDPAV